MFYLSLRATALSVALRSRRGWRGNLLAFEYFRSYVVEWENPKTGGAVQVMLARSDVFIFSLEIGCYRDDFLSKGFKRCNFVHIRHVEYCVGESHLGESLDTTENTINCIFLGEMDSSE